MDENFFKIRFDWNYYFNTYEDLQRAHVNTKEKLWSHAKNHGFQENRDIFKKNIELLNDFKYFCSTGKVKPIPDKYKNNTAINFITHVNNEKTLLVFYVDYLKSTLGVKNILNLLKNIYCNTYSISITNLPSEYPEFLNVTNHEDRTKINNIINTYTNTYIIYPSQLSKKIRFTELNNDKIKHVKIIHDLFPLDIGYIYASRANVDAKTYNTIHRQNFIEEINIFDIKLFYFPHFKYNSIKFENGIFIEFNRFKNYQNINNNIDNSNKQFKDIKILYSAQYQYRKNHKILNETIKQFRLECNIYCTGNDCVPQYDLKELNKLKEEKQNNLHFLGFLNNEEYTKLINECDGYIIPTIAEGGGYVVEEIIKTMKPIAINNYYTLTSVIFDLIPIDVPINTIKQIIFTQTFRTEDKCNLSESLNLKKNITIKKIDLLNKICNKYLPNLYIFDASSVLSTKNAIKWISTFKTPKYLCEQINNIKETNTKMYPLHSIIQVDKIKNTINSEINNNFKYFDFVKLQNLHNLYRDKKIFIFKDGQENTIKNLEIYKDEYTFCVNKFNSSYNKISWRPTFYYFRDEIIIEELYKTCSKNLDNLHSLVFCDQKTLNKFVYNDKLFIINEIDKPNNEVFQKNIHYGLYKDSSILENVIQIACYLGFNNIKLVGCDENDIKNIPINIINNYNVSLIF